MKTISMRVTEPVRTYDSSRYYTTQEIRDVEVEDGAARGRRAGAEVRAQLEVNRAFAQGLRKFWEEKTAEFERSIMRR